MYKNKFHNPLRHFIITLVIILSIPLTGFSQDDGNEWGMKVRVGGRYDDMRMCVASPPGAKGGMAADISLFANFNVNPKTTVHLDIPVMRPILFAAAFQMLQFEPTINLRYNKSFQNLSTLVYGAGIGVSFHYGPDYKAEEVLPDGENSYFALGPIFSGYIGYIPYKEKPSNFEFGISPYITPLFSINDSENRNGVIIGGYLDISYKF